MLETSPKMLVHGEMTRVTSEVLPVGSGYNHWIPWNMVKCALVMKATRLHCFESNCIQA